MPERLTLIVQVGKLRLKIDNNIREGGKLVVIIANKSTNVMDVPLEDLAQAVKVINELGKRCYALPTEDISTPDE